MDPKQSSRCRKPKLVYSPSAPNLRTDETILLDLKHLLKEAKQRVPHFLTTLDDPMEKRLEMEAATGVKGCSYCGGLGHRVTDCPKLRGEDKAKSRAARDYFGSGGFGGEV